MATERSDVLARINRVFDTYFGKPVENFGEDLVFDDSAEGGLNLDSLDQVELVMELETEFDVKIPDELAEKIKSVRAAADIIVEELDKQA